MYILYTYAHTYMSHVWFTNMLPSHLLKTKKQIDDSVRSSIGLLSHSLSLSLSLWYTEYSDRVMSSLVSLGISDFMFIGGMLHAIAEKQEEENARRRHSSSSHHGSCHAWLFRLLFCLHETLVSLISLLWSIANKIWFVANDRTNQQNTFFLSRRRSSS